MLFVISSEVFFLRYWGISWALHVRQVLYHQAPTNLSPAEKKC